MSLWLKIVNSRAKSYRITIIKDDKPFFFILLKICHKINLRAGWKYHIEMFFATGFKKKTFWTKHGSSV